MFCFNNWDAYVPNKNSYSHNKQQPVHPYMNFPPPYYNLTSSQYICQPPPPQYPLRYLDSEPVYSDYPEISEDMMSFMESTTSQLKEVARMIEQLKVASQEEVDPRILSDDDEEEEYPQATWDTDEDEVEDEGEEEHPMISEAMMSFMESTTAQLREMS